LLCSVRYLKSITHPTIEFNYLPQMADAGTGSVGLGVAALQDSAGMGDASHAVDFSGMSIGRGRNWRGALAWLLPCSAVGIGAGLSDFCAADRSAVCEFLAMVASSGIGFTGLPVAYVGRCTRLSNTLAGAAGFAKLREVANKCPGSGCRLRCRRWPESTSFGLPRRTLCRDRIQLALALGGGVSLPVGAGSLRRYLARRLACLRHGVLVPATGNNAARGSQGSH